MSANLRLPPGTPPNVSNQVTLAVEQVTKQMPGVLHVYANAGFGRGGNLDILLKPVRERGMSAEQWVQELQRRVDDRGFAAARVFVDRRAFAAFGRRAPATRSRSTFSVTTSVSSSSSAASSRSDCAVSRGSPTSTSRPTREVRSSRSCSIASARAH